MKEKLLNFLRQLKRNQSSASTCSVCGQVGVEFAPLPNFYRETLERYGAPHLLDDCETLNYKKYGCPKCGASDRDRLYALYMSKFLTERMDATNLTLLEIAPSKPLTEYLKKTKRISVRTADLMMSGVDDRVDITKMDCYADKSFDAFICSHVLEHVPDDRKALQELFRVTKPGGWGIVMVPIPLSLNHIDEDPLLADVGERWRRFGQDDHIRMYSKQGFVERIERAGFAVKQLGKDYFGEGFFTVNGIAASSVLYVAEKPASSSLNEST
jgi:SAM-dependent methyltransferase